MSADTKQELREIWKDVTEEFDGKSTEFCLEVAAQRARQYRVKMDCDASDIAEVIAT